MLRIFNYIFLLFAIIFFDQMSKWLIQHFMFLGQEKPLLPFLSFYYVRNTGIAFSFFSSFPIAFLVLNSFAVLGLLFYLWSKSGIENTLSSLAFIFIIAGAIGNLIDRLRFHYVIDFIYFHINTIFSFAIFNIADAFITLGAIFLAIDQFFQIKKNIKIHTE